MTVPSTMDAAGWLRNHLEGDDGDGDLARAMLQAFAQALMSAEASMQCRAGYNERSEERVNSRNGYRERRVGHAGSGTIDLAVPKLREGTYYPAWLLVPSPAGRAGVGVGGRPGLRRGRVDPAGRGSGEGDGDRWDLPLAGVAPGRPNWTARWPSSGNDRWTPARTGICGSTR